MKKLNFPFTAILGQDNMKEALVLNVIDPRIGGVLLTGQQGTGKSTAVRSLVEILPDIEEYEGCPFHDNPVDLENLCDLCQSGERSLVKHPIPLVNLPLGATEDMLIGSLDIEKIIQEGKRAILPGLLAKANRGILYVDEINLLQDHLVDILLDVSASGVNVIEREGISLSHPASFILVGSMNPEEGELRPQISDRLGVEVNIIAPKDPALRAEITQRVIDFNDNPALFVEKYCDQQEELKQKIIDAKIILPTVQIPPEIFTLASQIVLKLGLYSQRADITFIRFARARAAFRGSTLVEREDLQRAAFLVFENRMKRLDEKLDAQFLGDTFDEIFGKIPEAIEETKLYQPEEEPQMDTFKHSPDVKDKYKENPLNKENEDMPEVESGHRPSKDRHSNFNLDEPPEGYKAGDNDTSRHRLLESSTIRTNLLDQPLKMNLEPILDFLRQKRTLTNFSGRGNRVRILSNTSGRYVFARQSHGVPNSIAFDASIKSHFLNQPLTQLSTVTQDLPLAETSPNFNVISKEVPSSPITVQLNMEDIREKVRELRAPLSLYFIVDASASMCKSLEQIIKVIQSVHKEGYKKKDKLAVISFQGKESKILQRPTVSMSVALQKLRTLEPCSYTPIASALRKALTMIHQEQIKGCSIPIIIILSDLGANVSMKYANLSAQSDKDFRIIEQELDDIAQEMGKKKIKLVVMKPKKSFATRYLGVNPISVQKIQESFIHHTNGRIFEFDAYDPSATIVQLKRILE